MSLDKKRDNGKRVMLVYMDDKHTKLKSGDMGTAEDYDDIGQLHVSWDSGSSLALIPDVDKWTFV